MDTKIVNALGMIQATQLFLDENKAVFEDVPSMVRASSQLAGIVTLILAAQRQQSAKDGLAAEKAAAKSALADVAAEVCSVAHACADENELFAIAKRTDLSVSTVARGKDAQVIDRCKGILADAQTLVDDLEDCEITTAKCKALEAAIKKFEALKPKPRVGIADGKSATARLWVLKRRASALLRKRLDKLVVPFKKSNPEFYGSYKAARKIVNLAATHDAAKVTVVAGTTAKAA